MGAALAPLNRSQRLDAHVLTNPAASRFARELVLEYLDLFPG